jgi:Mrp family chromosome partitioning ATPase
MASLSTESTPRERLLRLCSLLQRTRMFWRSSALIALVGALLAIIIALEAKQAFRSETTVVYRDAIQTKDGEPAAQRLTRLGPKLKDLLYARPRLEQVIRAYDLFPDKVKKSMLDAIEEMQQAVSFRARSSDSFVVSFTYDDPDIAQEVTARLAGQMIDEYNRQNLDTATQTRDFLQREFGEANMKVDEASRALATFLAEHPQFQWGLNDSPYAPTNGEPGMGGGYGAHSGPQALGRHAVTPALPADPQLVGLFRELANVEMKLGVTPSPSPLTGPPLDAQRQRNAAAQALADAQKAQSERLAVVTPAHPDAIAAKNRVEIARQNLAAAEAALRVSQGGAPQPAVLDLAPEKRTELEQRRDAIRAQLTERRARLAPASAAAAPLAGTARGAVAAKTPDIVDLETEWHRLRLELDRAREQLRIVQTTAHAAEISADAAEKKSQEEMQVLEPAYRPVRPDRGRGRVFLAGITIGIFFALGYAATRVLLNDTLLDEGDIVAIGGPKVLVSLPRMPDLAQPTLVRQVVTAMGPEPLDMDPKRVEHRDPPRPSAGRSAYRPDARATEALRHGSAGRDQAPEGEGPRRPIAPIVPEMEASDLAEPGDIYRVASTTIRFGASLPLPREEIQRVTVRVCEAAALVVRPADTIVRALLDEPDVEVVGTDVDMVGAGAETLLRKATPAARASLRVLRHRLEQRRASGAFVVSVVSPGPGEGKSVLAAQLALTLSESDRARVVLVEGNLMRPAVAAMLGIKLASNVSLSAQVRQRMNGNAQPWGLVRLSGSLMALAEAAREAVYPDALHSPHFAALLASLRRSFDYVIVDGPSVLGAGDANVIEGVSDGVLLVARAASTRGASLFRATAQLGERRILGVVLNGVVQPEEHAA